MGRAAICVMDDENLLHPDSNVQSEDIIQVWFSMPANISYRDREIYTGQSDSIPNDGKISVYLPPGWRPKKSAGLQRGSAQVTAHE
jgi:hypothetical protein